MDAQKLKVIISIDSIKYPITGIGRYTYELVRELSKNNGIKDLLFLRGAELIDGLPDFKEIHQGQSHSHLYKRKLKSFLQKSNLIFELYRHCNTWQQSNVLKRKKDYIYHSTNFFLPKFDGLKVATFHDLSPFKYPECNSKQHNKYLKKRLLHTINFADYLITDSEYTRKEISDYFNYPINKITAVPLACSDNYYPRDENELLGIFKQYDLSYKQYSLFVGTIEPRKNISSLIDAYALLPLALRRKYPLVITGYQGWKSEDIHQKMQKAEIEGWLHYLGYVPSDHLPLLYAGARIFIFPSLYEGFGLPLLESMASGTPVLSSHSSSLLEVGGEAVSFFDPLDVYGLSKLIEEGLEDEAWQQTAIKRGFEQVDKFSWERCAQETVAVYKKMRNK